MQLYIATIAISMTKIGIRILLMFSIPFSTPIAIMSIVNPRNNKNQTIGSTGEVISCSNTVRPATFVAATSFAGIEIYDHKNLRTHPPITQ